MTTQHTLVTDRQAVSLIMGGATRVKYGEAMQEINMPEGWREPKVVQLATGTRGHLDAWARQSLAAINSFPVLLVLAIALGVALHSTYAYLTAPAPAAPRAQQAPAPPVRASLPASTPATAELQPLDEATKSAERAIQMSTPSATPEPLRAYPSDADLVLGQHSSPPVRMVLSTPPVGPTDMPRSAAPALAIASSKPATTLSVRQEPPAASLGAAKPSPPAAVLETRIKPEDPLPAPGRVFKAIPQGNPSDNSAIPQD